MNAKIFNPIKQVEQKLSDLQKEILQLKKEKNAIILVHNYQRAQIQEIADFIGDSLALARQAQKATEDVIVFCGVHFMAETAKILNPSKKVILPNLDAGCSLADSCKAEDLRLYKEKNPDTYIVSYINCSADVKCLSDVICTSGNADKIVSKIPQDKEIMFLPDKNLGQWVSQKLDRKIQLWDGGCHLHQSYDKDALVEIKKMYPRAKTVAHPECPKEIRDLADFVCSTEKMISYCKEEKTDTFIIITESSMIHRLQNEFPDKTFISPDILEENACYACSTCKYMRLNTLENLRDCLKNLSPELILSEEVIEKANKPLCLMLEYS